MAKRVRFLAWYRSIPLAIVLVFGAACWLYAYAPAPLVQMIYPLRYEEQILDSATARPTPISSRGHRDDPPDPPTGPPARHRGHVRIPGRARRRGAQALR